MHADLLKDPWGMPGDNGGGRPHKLAGCEMSRPVAPGPAAAAARGVATPFYGGGRGLPGLSMGRSRGEGGAPLDKKQTPGKTARQPQRSRSQTYLSPPQQRVSPPAR